MSGSALAPIVIPPVALVVLFGWLAMVCYADRHPMHAGRDAASSRSVTGEEAAPEFPAPRPSPDEALRDEPERARRPPGRDERQPG